MGQVLEPMRDYDVHAEEGNGLRACFASIQGWRQTQEDDHTVSCRVPGRSDLSLFAVFDGHGGSSASKFAAENLLRIFADSLPEGALEPSVLSDHLRKAILETDNALADGQGRVRFLNEGCTAIISVISRKHIVTANVGDSRAILVTLGGTKDAPKLRVDALSTDQKPANEAEEARIRAADMAVIDCNGIARVNGDLAVARAIGDFAFKNPDLAQEKQAVTCDPEISVQERALDVAQILCLACDGIWDVMSNDQVAQFIATQLRSHGEIYTTAARIVDNCLDAGSRDNMSVLICDLNLKFKLGDKPVYVPPRTEEHDPNDEFSTPPPIKKSNIESSSDGSSDGSSDTQQ